MHELPAQQAQDRKLDHFTQERSMTVREYRRKFEEILRNTQMAAEYDTEHPTIVRIMVDKFIAGFLPRIRQGIAHGIYPTLDAAESAAQLVEYRMEDSQDSFSIQDLKDAMKEAAKEALKR